MTAAIAPNVVAALMCAAGAAGALLAQVPHVRRMRPVDPRREIDRMARRDRKAQR